MYEAFYQLTANPFRLVPDAGICFRHEGYARARAYLRYALKQGEGFILISGPPGIGKTTLISEFLAELESSGILAASIAATNFEATDLLRAVAYAWGINVEGLDRVTLVRRIRQFLQQRRQQGQRALLIVDEAQGLSYPALEELRLLSDLQAGSSSLLQVFLVGQEKLQRVMSVPELEQLQQRVIGTCFLEPMEIRETSAYMQYRLRLAGWQGDPELTGGALLVIYEYSRGVPRHINKIANRLLLYGSVRKKHELDRTDVLTIIDELRAEQLAPLENAQQSPLVVKELENGNLSLDELALTKNTFANPVSSLPVETSADAIDLHEQPAELSSAEHGLQNRVKRQARWLVNAVSRSGNAVWLSATVIVLVFSAVAMVNYRGGESGGYDTLSGELYRERLSGPAGDRLQPETSQSAPLQMQAEVSVLEPLSVTVSTARQTDSVSAPIVRTRPVGRVRTPAPEFNVDQLTGFPMQVATGGVVELLLPPGVATDDGVVGTDEGSARRANGEPQPLPVQETAVTELLVLAGRSLEQDRLLIPDKNNAYYYYSEVLEQDPGNRKAINGLDRVAARYVVLASRAIERDDGKAARRFIQRGLSVRPDNESLLSMRDQLQAAADAARVVTVEQPAGDADSPSGGEGFFTRLKHFFDSDKARVEQPEIWTEESAW